MTDERYREVPLNQLHLDPSNPRLRQDIDWSKEPESIFLREFARKYNLVELARSIADKGFTPRHAEALLVVQKTPAQGATEDEAVGPGAASEAASAQGAIGDKAEEQSADDETALVQGTTEASHFIVIEGNRRLATLKLLTSEDNRRKAEVTNREWQSLAQDASDLDTDRIPVVVYPDRESLDDYLGFRHITGPTPWRPEAKARFVVKLLRSGETIGEAARRIGSNHRTVRRYAEAHVIYMQAARAGIPMEGAEAAFGVFYNALDQEGVRSFLELGPQVDIQALPETPVSEDNMTHLSELIELLYGDPSRGIQRVIKESRDLRKLGQVLANERARANLLRERDLERAWRVSGGGRTDVIGSLVDIHGRLSQINGQAHLYSDDEGIKDEVRLIYALAVDTAKNYGVDDV